MPYLPRASLLVLAAAVILPSCAKEVEYDAYNTYPIYQYEQEVTLLTALKSAPFTSDYTVSSGYADKVGLIAMAAGPRSSLGQKLGQCSGFLIDRNIVATNSHCMTEEIMRNRDCSQNLAIKFLNADSAGKNIYSCKRVIKKSVISEEELDQADWAFFEIEATDRAPLRISRSGITDEAAIRSVRVNPFGNGQLGGTLTSADCQTAQSSILNPSYTSEYSRTALAIGCGARQGNSGSPVFNASTGEVIGILQSYVTDNYMKLVNKKLAGTSLTYPSSPPAHFIFTNLSCVEDPRTGASFNDIACARARTPYGANSRNEDAKRSLTQALLREGSRWELSLPKLALYAVSVDKDGLNLVAAPLCLRPLSEWPEEVLASKTSDGYVFQEHTYRASIAATLRIKPEFKLDDALRLSREMSASSQAEARIFTFTFSKEGGEVKTKMLSKYGGSYGGTDLEGIGWCTPEQLAKGNVALSSPGLR
jgi:hypothetical protein